MSTVSGRFWAKVHKTAGCWWWTGSLAPNGYGRFRLGPRTEGANRIAYVLAFGPIDAALHVLHRCDRPPCVRPDHLFLGTPLDNMRDKVAKGRHVLPFQAGPATDWRQLVIDELCKEFHMTNPLPKVLPITERQRDVLVAIEQTKAARGYGPTLRELCSLLGLSSTNGMHQHLEALERKGYIARDADVARGIRVLVSSADAELALPGLRKAVSACPHCGKAVA